MTNDGEGVRGGTTARNGNGGTTGHPAYEPNKQTARTVTYNQTNDGWKAGNGGGLGTLSY